MSAQDAFFVLVIFAPYLALAAVIRVVMLLRKGRISLAGPLLLGLLAFVVLFSIILRLVDPTEFVWMGFLVTIVIGVACQLEAWFKRRPVVDEPGGERG